MEKLPLLLIAYQRPENLMRILSGLPTFVDEIFISLDYPSVSTLESNARFLEIQNLIEDFQIEFKGNINLHVRTANVGCSANVVSSCDWFFSHVQFGAILEDDCLPSMEFFELVNGAKKYLESEPEILLVSGHQVAPNEISGNTWSLSKFPLIWGWATTAAKWETMKSLIVSEHYLGKNSNISRIDLRTSSFFKAGARRSHKGYMDAWDAPLAYGMLVNNFKSILPPRNLIRNVGFDSVAVHTSEKSKGLNQSWESLEFEYSEPRELYLLDNWIEKNYFVVRYRHVFTTRITRLLDMFQKAKLENLAVRVLKARI